VTKAHDNDRVAGDAIFDKIGVGSHDKSANAGPARRLACVGMIFKRRHHGKDARAHSRLALRRTRRDVIKGLVDLADCMIRVANLQGRGFDQSART
jgi:hypothetical protein